MVYSKQNSDIGLTTFALSDQRRRLKAKKQPRDMSGRWVGAGANVKWKSHGTNWAGTIKAIRDGKAQVEVRNPDGTTSNTTLDIETLRVSTSKARIPTTKTTIQDNGSGFKATFAENLKKIETDGGIIIQDVDGYSAEARKRRIGGNDVIYQLFAPNGRSLGEASTPDNFDLMKKDHMSGSDETLLGDDTEEQKVTPTGTVKRVSRDGSEAIVASAGEYRLVSLEFGHVVEVSANISSLLASGSWRKALPEDNETVHTALVAAANAPKPDVVMIDEKSIKPYRVPKAVKDEISYALQNYEWPEEDALVACALTGDDPVGIEEVEWISEFFQKTRPDEQLHGGYKGQKWADKIISEPISEESLGTQYKFDDDLSYFGLGMDETAPLVDKLVAVDFGHGHVYTWNSGGFELSEGTVIESVEAPMVLPLDPETASGVAMWLDSGSRDQLDVRDLNWEERLLFESAEGEMDFEELHDLQNAVVAAANDGVYTPQERSANARRQRRGPGGRFGDGPISPKGETLTSMAKARLDTELPIIENPWEQISAWAQSLDEPSEMKKPVRASGEEMPGGAPQQEDAASEEAQDSGMQGEALYFAIVDPVDKAAVMDVVAVTKKDGSPKIWKRSGGAWEADPGVSQALQGATPPPLVKLDEPEPATGVISQVDSYDSDSITAAAYSDEQRSKDAAKGYAMKDGSYPIRNLADLKNAVKAYGRAKESDRAAVKRHIRKRAKALNHMEVVPEKWRAASVQDVGEALANTSPLYGEFGEVIVAAGVPGIADTPSDWAAVNRLKNYWKYGAGAAKIRWGSPGDLTRAHRHLAKYVTDPWGLAQKLHMELFGVSNAKRDK